MPALYGMYHGGQKRAWHPMEMRGSRYVGAGNRTQVLCRSRKCSEPSFSPALYLKPRQNCLESLYGGRCANTALAEGGSGSVMGTAIATVNVKFPSPSRVPGPAMSSNWGSPTKGLSQTVALSGGLERSHSCPYYSSTARRSPQGVRTPHFRPRWKRTAQAPKAGAGHVSLQGCRPARNRVHAVPGGRGGGGVRRGCQVLKGPRRWSREAVPGVSAGSSAGSAGRMKGLVSSEWPMVGGERGNSKRVGSGSE